MLEDRRMWLARKAPARHGFLAASSGREDRCSRRRWLIEGQHRPPLADAANLVSPPPITGGLAECACPLLEALPRRSFPSLTTPNQQLHVLVFWRSLQEPRSTLSASASCARFPLEHTLLSSPLHSPLCRPRSSSGVYGPRQLSPARRVSLH